MKPLYNLLRIYIAGHTGLVGSALKRYFSKYKSFELILKTHNELDLTNQNETEHFLNEVKPDVIIIAAGKVGGIQANLKYPADFIYQNLMIESNLIHGAWKAGIHKVLNFGSSCMYPKLCPQPMKPSYLMSNKLEPTNEPYAIAKLAGMFLCSSFNKQYGTQYINIIPSNIYGPGDSFDLERCHVISALIRKLHEAKMLRKKEIVLWGSGNAKRDFIFVNDLCEACHILLEKYSLPEPINVGAESPLTIKELVTILCDLVKFEGKITWDTSCPDGAPERLLDAFEIRKIGWSPKTDLCNGLKQTYQWFLEKSSYLNKGDVAKCISS